mgnify:CR=1 FL=1
MDFDVFYRTFDVSDVAPGVHVIDLVFYAFVLFCACTSLLIWVLLIVYVSRIGWKARNARNSRNPGGQTGSLAIPLTVIFSTYAVVVAVSTVLVVFPGPVSAKIFSMDRHGEGGGVPLLGGGTPIVADGLSADWVKMDRRKPTFIEKYHQDILVALSQNSELQQYNLLGCEGKSADRTTAKGTGQEADRSEADHSAPQQMDRNGMSILCGGYKVSPVAAEKDGTTYQLTPVFKFGEDPGFVRRAEGVSLENSADEGLAVRFHVYVMERAATKS